VEGEFFAYDIVLDDTDLELYVDYSWYGAYYPQGLYSPAEYPEAEINDVKGKFNTIKPIPMDKFLLQVLKELKVERKYMTQPVLKRLARNKSVLALIQRAIASMDYDVPVSKINGGPVKNSMGQNFYLHVPVEMRNPVRGNKIVLEPVLTNKSHDVIDEELWDNGWFEYDSKNNRY
jgi:hypothetical protein